MSNMRSLTSLQRRVPAGTHGADQADPLNADRSSSTETRGPLRPIHLSDANMRHHADDRGENSEPGETRSVGDKHDQAT